LPGRQSVVAGNNAGKPQGAILFHEQRAAAVAVGNLAIMRDSRWRVR
jgi:hypothetical protein